VNIETRRRPAGRSTRPRRAARARTSALRGATLVVCLSLTVAVAACGGSSTSQLHLIYASSMIVPFDHLAAQYSRASPSVKVTTESHGSIQVIRQVTDIHRSFDVLVTADDQLIGPMMEATKEAATGKPYAAWYIQFATNRMVLAYSPKGRLAGRVTAANWWRLLSDRSVRMGIADPRFDASGYRALMVLQLAEWLYRQPTLVEQLTLGQFEPAITTEHVGNGEVIHVPELLDTTGGSRVVMRGASIQLLPLLESGDIDCAFEYESVVRQHGLPFVELPPQVDLGSPGYKDLYGRVTVKLDLRRFASVLPQFRGGVVTYAVTIPTNAPDAVEAQRFLSYLLGPAGRKALLADRQPVLVPARAQGYESLPAALKALCVPLRAGQ
jgi:molybdate/tungstate transport system substrate-binding protein